MKNKYSRKMYDKRKLPDFKFNQDYTVKGILYIKGDEYDTYHFNYDRLIELLEDNIICELKKVMKPQVRKFEILFNPNDIDGKTLTFPIFGVDAVLDPKEEILEKILCLDSYKGITLKEITEDKNETH